MAPARPAAAARHFNISTAAGLVRQRAAPPSPSRKPLGLSWVSADVMAAWSADEVGAAAGRALDEIGIHPFLFAPCCTGDARGDAVAAPRRAPVFNMLGR